MNVLAEVAPPQLGVRGVCGVGVETWPLTTILKHFANLEIYLLGVRRGVGGGPWSRGPGMTVSLRSDSGGQRGTGITGRAEAWVMVGAAEAG